MARDRVVPFFMLLASLSVLPPCVWHFKARNWTIIVLAAYLFVWNFVLGINAFIWWSDADNKAPVWCDISSKLTTMWTIGVPCSSLCIARRLERIASTRVVTVTSFERRKQIAIDVTIALLIPLLYTTVSIVYQGHRFDIIEGIGCNPAVYTSWVYIVFGVVPPPVVSLITIGFSVMCLRHFIVRQKQFTAVLSSNGSKLNRSRYLRIMMLNITEICITFPIFVILQILNINGYKLAWRPYESWADVHAGFYQVLQIPASTFDIPALHRSWIQIEISRWIAPVSGLMLLFFFGFSAEAKQEYREWASYLKRGVKGVGKSRREFQDGSSSSDRTYELPHLATADDVIDINDQKSTDGKFDQNTVYSGINIHDGTLLLMRKLEAIASTRQVAQPIKSRTAVELACGILCPFLLVPARYVVQGHRNNIILGYDSSPPLFVSIPSLFLAQLPQLAISTVNVFYAALVLRWFIIRRRQFSAILHSSASNIDKRRYIRLMLLCCFELFLAWPLALLVNIYNLKVIGLRPYESWSYVHADWSAVWVFSYNDLDTVLKAALLVPKWMTVQIAFAFFGFFGLSSETYTDLSRLIRRFTGRQERQTVTGKSSQTSFNPPTLQSLPDLEDGKDEDEMKTAWIPLQVTNVLVTSERVVSAA